MERNQKVIHPYSGNMSFVKYNISYSKISKINLRLKMALWIVSACRLGDSDIENRKPVKQ